MNWASGRSQLITYKYKTYRIWASIYTVVWEPINFKQPSRIAFLPNASADFSVFDDNLTIWLWSCSWCHFALVSFLFSSYLTFIFLTQDPLLNGSILLILFSLSWPGNHTKCSRSKWVSRRDLPLQQWFSYHYFLQWMRQKGVLGEQ